MEQKIIVEEQKDHEDEKGFHTGNTTIKLHREEDKVVFDYWTVTCDAADNWHSQGIFSVENYQKGVQELLENGSCSISGIFDETLRLRILSEEDVMRWEFIGELRKKGFIIGVEFRGHNGLNTYLRCEPEKLVLR